MKNAVINLLDNYTIEYKNQNSEDTILKDRETGRFVLMRQFVIVGNQQLKSIIETLSMQKMIRNQHILVLIDYHLKQIKYQSTGSLRQQNNQHEILALYQKASHTLQQQIQLRSHDVIKHYFEEAELWSILWSAVKGLACLQKQEIAHGCITTSDIFLTQNGKIKIIDPSLAILSPFQFTSGYYYSPQMIQCFSQREKNLNHYEQNQIDIYKSDVFSLGMCLLECALLESCSDCYDYKYHTIRPNTLKHKFNSLINSYSESFLDILYQMMSFDIEKRPNFIELQKHLQNYLDDEDSNPVQIKDTRTICIPRQRIQFALPDIDDLPDEQFIFVENTEYQNHDFAQNEQNVDQINSRNLRESFSHQAYFSSFNLDQNLNKQKQLRKQISQLSYNSRISQKENDHPNRNNGQYKVDENIMAAKKIQINLQKKIQVKKLKGSLKAGPLQKKNEEAKQYRESIIKMLAFDNDNGSQIQQKNQMKKQYNGQMRPNFEQTERRNQINKILKRKNIQLRQ